MLGGDVVVVIGQIGAGKSALCRELESSASVRHVDIEDLRCPDGRRMGAGAIAAHVASAAAAGPVAFECSGASRDFEEVIEDLRLRGLGCLVVLLDCNIRTALRRVRERHGRIRPRAGGTWASQLRWTESRLRLVPADLTLSSDTSRPASIARAVRNAWESVDCEATCGDTVRLPRELSFTHLAAFQICPWSYRLKYMDHVKEIVETEQMYLGSRLHEALAWLYSGESRGKTELVAWFRNRLTETLPADTDHAAAARLFQTGQDALVLHHDVVYRKERGKTIAVEGVVRMPLDNGLTFVGRVDRVAVDPSGTVEVIDYKASARRRTSRPRIPDSLQIASYSVAVLRELDQRSVIARRIMLATGEEERFAVSAEDARQVTLSLTRWTRGLLAGRGFPTLAGSHCASCQFNPICTEGAEYPIARGAFIRKQG